MAAIVAVLWNGLLAILGSVVWQAIIALGVGIVTYQGADTSLDYFKNLAVTNLTALPPGVLGLLGYMKVGKCVSMICSAIVMRMTAQGLKAGASKQWRFK